MIYSNVPPYIVYCSDPSQQESGGSCGPQFCPCPYGPNEQTHSLFSYKTKIILIPRSVVNQVLPCETHNSIALHHPTPSKIEGEILSLLTPIGNLPVILVDAVCDAPHQVPPFLFFYAPNFLLNGGSVSVSHVKLGADTLQ